MSCGPFKFGSFPSKCGQFLKWMYCRLAVNLADLGCRSGVYYEQPLHNPVREGLPTTHPGPVRFPIAPCPPDTIPPN